MASNIFRTVLLKGTLARRYEEARGTGSIMPGHMIEKVTLGKVQVQSVRGGSWTRAVAVEDALQGLDGVNTKGNTINDAYVNDNLVRYIHVDAGEIWNALLAPGENVLKGDWATGFGDGTVCKAAAAYLANAVAASAAHTNTGAETTYSNGSVVIPANTLKVGDVIRVRSQGILTATNGADTLLIKAYMGTDALVSAQGIDAVNGDIWLLDITIVIRTIGAAGTFVATGSFAIGPVATTLKDFVLGSTAINTTVAQTLAVKGTWSAANAGNSARQDIFQVEHVKAGPSANGTSVGRLVGTFEDEVDNSAGIVAVRAAVLAM